MTATPNSSTNSATPAMPTLEQEYQAAMLELDEQVAAIPQADRVYTHHPDDKGGMDVLTMLAREEQRQCNNHYEELRALVEKVNILLPKWDRESREAEKAAMEESIRHGLKTIIDYFEPANGMIPVPHDAAGEKDRHLLALHTVLTSLLRQKLPEDVEAPANGVAETIRQMLSGLSSLTGFGAAQNVDQYRPTIEHASAMRQKLQHYYTVINTRRQVMITRRTWLERAGWLAGGSAATMMFMKGCATDTPIAKPIDPKDAAPDDILKFERFEKEFSVAEIPGQRKVRVTVPNDYVIDNEQVVIRMATGPGKDLVRVNVGPDGTVAIPDSVIMNQTLFFTFWLLGDDGRYLDGAANNAFRRVTVTTPFVNTGRPTPAPDPMR